VQIAGDSRLLMTAIACLGLRFQVFDTIEIYPSCAYPKLPLAGCYYILKFNTHEFPFLYYTSKNITIQQKKA
jgi:hypothetical protein